MAPYIDYKVYLEISPEECKKRATIRDSTATLGKYNEKYLPAQARYIREFNPAGQADMVVDNTRPEYPKYSLKHN